MWILALASTALIIVQKDQLSNRHFKYIRQCGSRNEEILLIYLMSVILDLCQFPLPQWCTISVTLFYCATLWLWCHCRYCVGLDDTETLPPLCVQNAQHNAVQLTNPHCRLLDGTNQRKYFFKMILRWVLLDMIWPEEQTVRLNLWSQSSGSRMFFENESLS